MAKDFAKILDIRNLKAVKYRFDVKAERDWTPWQDAKNDPRCPYCKDTPHDSCGYCRALALKDTRKPPKRDDHEISPLSTWME